MLDFGDVNALLFSRRDIEIFARTLFGEGRGVSWDAKVAIAWAVRNRVETDLGNDGAPDWWGEGYVGVCQSPGQFSCWNAKDPNRPKVLAVTLDNVAFRECFAVAAAVMSGLIPSPIADATHYYAPSVVAEPSWARAVRNGRKARLVCNVGPHLFFADVP